MKICIMYTLESISFIYLNICDDSWMNIFGQFSFEEPPNGPWPLLTRKMHSLIKM